MAVDLIDSKMPQHALLEILSKELPKYNSLEDFISHLENIVVNNDGHQRKIHGVFYTPKSIVDLILNEMEFPPLGSNHAPTLLDLSCGTGHFLVEGLRRLNDFFLQQGLSPLESARVAVRSIEGVEVDPVARNIARIFLLGNFYELVNETQIDKGEFPEIQVYQRDCLLGNIDCLSKGAGSWDFLILNPPYVSQKGERNAPKISVPYARVLKEQFDCLNPRVYKDKWGINVPGHLKINLLVPFIEKAIKMLAPHGRLGFIVHKNFLDVGSYWPLRHFILETCEIRKIIDLTTAAFPQITGETVIVILEKKTPNTHLERQIEILPQWNSPRFIISQQRFRESFQESFLIYPREEHYALRNKIWRSGLAVKLGDLATLSSFGINVPHTCESTLAEHPEWVPAIRGRDIGRLLLLGSSRVVNFTPEALSRNGQTALFASPIKIIMQRVGPRLQACLDLEQRVCFNSTNMIVPHAPDVNFAKYLLAILNSPLIDAYYKRFLSNQNVLTVNVTQAKLAELPVVLPTPPQQRSVVSLVEAILCEPRLERRLELEKQINVQISEIYHLSSADIAALQSP